jgi:very-short-patch-repair endonuclease
MTILIAKLILIEIRNRKSRRKSKDAMENTAIPSNEKELEKNKKVSNSKKNTPKSTKEAKTTSVQKKSQLPVPKDNELNKKASKQNQISIDFTEKEKKQKSKAKDTIYNTDEKATSLISNTLPDSSKVAKSSISKTKSETAKKNEDKDSSFKKQLIANYKGINTTSFEVTGKGKSEKADPLPKAKTESARATDKILLVDYDITRQTLSDSYPQLRFPKKGTVVRSYRIGNTKRRGFKEETFQLSIERYFGQRFSILGNARLNTGKETRPFEPDIAIVDRKDTNLRIDVEVDEPYAGVSRQPTHCKGEDYLRDLYFVDRGWIVIRFSEYQVHQYEMGCLQFIAELIKTVIPSFVIPKELQISQKLPLDKIWDIVKAQKWEKANYREKYLGHTFTALPEQAETIERAFSAQELAEEKLVQSSFKGKLEERRLTGFNNRNEHTRDRRVQFFPDEHVYTIDNTPAPSASTIISNFFPEFDAEYWASRKASEFGMTPNEVELMWKNKGQEAAKQGAFLHEQIEKFFLKQSFSRTIEFDLFEQFVRDHQHLEPYRTEWRIFDEQYHIAGTIDFVTKTGNDFEIYDWKRSKKVIDALTGEPITDNQWQIGVGQLSHIDDTSYNRYCLQQSLYKFILEKNYGLRIKNMYLIVLYPDYDRYYKVEVPYLKDEIEFILKSLHIA